MKNLKFLPVFVFTILFTTLNLPLLSQENPSHVWTETSVEDFSKGTLNNVIITDYFGGEIKLPHPMEKTVEDVRDDAIHRYISTDSSGNYVKVWYNGKIVSQRYSSDDTAISDIIQISDAGLETISRVALMNDSTYIVIWGYSDSHNSYGMYGQIINSANEKVNSVFTIYHIDKFSDLKPAVFANETDGNFWVLFSLNTNDGYKIYIQKRDKNGIKIGGDSLLETGEVVKRSLRPSVADDKLDNFIVCWEGSNTNSSEKTDIYFRKFNYNGEPLNSPKIVNDDGKFVSQSQVDVCSDNNNNFLIVWNDFRDNTSQFYPYTYNIYGQYLEQGIDFIGNNFKLNNIATILNNRSPDAIFRNGIFQVSYIDGSIRPERKYTTSWKYNPIKLGYFESKVLDVGGSGAEFLKINWAKYLRKNSSIKFKLRSSDKLAQIESAPWFGPSNDTSSYYTLSSESISQIHNGNRFIQYKAFFNTDIVGKSSQLYSISISYNSSDTTAPSAPNNISSVSGKSKINLLWNANTETDLAKYRIYRGVTSHSYNPSWTKEVLPSETSYLDTSAQNGKTYYYAITAVDSSYNESEFSLEISASPLFTTYYVSVSGSSSGDGTFNNPFKTINAAINLATYGDIIIVLPGVYKENIRITKGVSVIASNNLEPVIIKSNGNKDAIEMSGESSITGFTILKTGNGSAIFCNKGSLIKIKNNSFIHEHGTGMPTSSAIIGQFSEAEITGNHITSFYAGIMGFKCNYSINNNIIECIKGIKSSGELDANIFNNIFLQYFEERSAIIETWIDGNISVFNNIFLGLNSDKGKGIENKGGIVSASFNNFWMLKDKYAGSVNEGFGTFSSNPLFVDRENNDFHLQETSPCIDAGDNNSIYNDLDGSRNDIGAYGGATPYIPLNKLRTLKKMHITNISGFPGDTVFTYILLDTPNGLGMADFSIGFDKNILTSLSVELTSATANFILQSEIINNSIKIHLEGKIIDNNTQQNILKIFFRVNDNVLSGVASQLPIENPKLFDEDLHSIFLTTITDGVFIANQGVENGNYVFVNGNNSDVGDGSRKNPFKIIQDAISFAKNGDTVIVAAGNYYGVVNMKDSVCLRGAGAKVTNIISKTDDACVIFNSTNSTELSGFTFSKNGNFPTPVLVAGHNCSPLIKNNRFNGDGSIDMIGFTCSGNSNPIIKSNSFENAEISIISSNATITENYILTSNRGFDGGISCSDTSSFLFIAKNKIISSIRINRSSSTIVNNWFVQDENHRYAVSIRDVNNAIVENNIIEGISVGSVGIKIKNSSNVNVINNTIATKQYGILETSSTANILNNIITGNSNFGIQALGTSVIDYNNVWNNELGYSNCFPGNNDISENPLFINTDGSNYNLLPSSSCINAGSPESKYNDTDGTRNDIGAYGGSHSDLAWLENERVSLKIDSIKVVNADSIYVRILGSAIRNVANMEMTLSFNSDVLEFSDVKLSNVTSSFSISTSILSSNTIKLVFDSQYGITENNGCLAELLFINKAENSLETFLNFNSAGMTNELSNKKAVGSLSNSIISITVTDVENPEIPTEYKLHQNYPNPFNPSTIIEYSLPEKNIVEIKLYDLLGREVRTLVNKEKVAGNYKVDFNAIGLSTGVYFYRIKAGSFIKTKKMLLLR